MLDEGYDHTALHSRRANAVAAARDANYLGIIFGTLGRQGNTGILRRIEAVLQGAGKKYHIFLMPEVSQEKLNEYPEIEAWI
jgi:diphthamide biosynthesis enzyme Dph1/Dph2-like protein